MMLLALNFTLVMLTSFTVLGVYLRRAAAGSNMQKRLRTIHVAVLEKAESQVALEKATKRGKAAFVTRHLRRGPFAAQIEKLLLESDSHLTVLSAALASGCSAVGVGLCWLLLAPLPLLALPAMVAGSGLPYVVLNWQRSRRLKAFNAALPDALDLMTRALRAGHAMSSAMEVVGQESVAPLGTEFASVCQQQKLGVRFRDAMLEMGQRIPSSDLHFLITAILVQRETGGDITEILERTTHIIRERARIEADVKTRTAQGRLTGWILSLLPVVLLAMISVINPGYSQILFHDPTGRKLLYAGGGFIVVGALIIRKIVDVQV